MKLSIIIPVYDVENYLEACIKSVLNQDIKGTEYEIIIVNDGSPDNSENIIKKFHIDGSNIIYIKQDNKGVSVARNRGLDVAEGEYILFVDPDDTIEANALNEIYEHAKKLELDLLYLKLDGYNEAGDHILEYDACGHVEVVLGGLKHPRRTFPATMYSRKIINGIRFVPGIVRAQDTVFNAMVHSLASRVSYLDKPFYKYLHRPSSSKQYVNSKRVFEGCLLGISSLLNFRRLQFDSDDELASIYFETVIKIFMERILQWNILPDLNKDNFIKFRSFVNNNSLDELLNQMAEKYKFVNKRYYQFYVFHKLYRLKKIISA